MSNSPPLNRTLEGIPGYASLRTTEAIRNDPDVVNLSLGEPWFGPPAMLPGAITRITQDSARLASLSSHYSDSLGLIELRRAIAARYRRLYGLDVDPERSILVTHGAVEAIWLTILVCTEAGDEVLIGDPSYMLYVPLVETLGRVPVRVPTHAQSGFVIGTEGVAERLSSRTRLLIVNSPENPTGAVCGESQLRALLQLANERQFFVLHDEVYDAFSFDVDHSPATMFDPELAIMANGFSKKFGMPGWRLGWMTASPRIIALASKAHNYFSLSSAGFAQAVGAEVLESEEAEEELLHNARSTRARSQWFAEELARIPGFALQTGAPRGGLFVFPDVHELHDALVGRTERRRSRSVAAQSPGERVAQALLEQCKIAVVPGSVYGPGGADHVRMVVAVEEQSLIEALERLRRFSEQVMA